MFSLRIVTIDHYNAFPVENFDVHYSSFRNTKVYQVPIIRIFGTTKHGEKCCLHVHGFFPYFSVQASAFSSTETPERISRELDKQINYKLQKPQKANHVFNVELVKATNFYGYHPQAEIFYRFYFYSEKARKQAANIFRSGRFLEKQFDIFEAHFNFITQFFVNYNLFGMAFINLSCVCPRGDTDPAIFSNLFGRQVSRFPSEKITNCHLELDCSVEHILNCLNVSAQLNPGLSHIWTEEIQRRAQGNFEETIFKDIEDTSERDPPLSELEKEYRISLTDLLQNSNTQGLQDQMNVRDEAIRSQTFQTQSEDYLNPNGDRSNFIFQQELIERMKSLSKIDIINAELMEEILENQYEEKFFQITDADEQDEFDQNPVQAKELSQCIDYDIDLGDETLVQSPDSDTEQEESVVEVGRLIHNVHQESIIFTPVPVEEASSGGFLEESGGEPLQISKEKPLFSQEECGSISSDSLDLQLKFLDASNENLIEKQGVTSAPVDTSMILFESQSDPPSQPIVSQKIFSFYNFESQMSSKSSQAAPTGHKRPRLFSDNSFVLSPNENLASTSLPSTSERRKPNKSQITNDFVWKIQQLEKENTQGLTGDHVYQHITIMCMELFAISDNEIKPNPELDPIKMVFYEIYKDSPSNDDSASNKSNENHFTGAILFETDGDHLDLSTHNNDFVQHRRNLFHRSGFYLPDLRMHIVDNEVCLIEKLLSIVLDYDPEIMIGYEVETASWGYLMVRANRLGIDCGATFSRLKAAFQKNQSSPESVYSTFSENSNSSQDAPSKYMNVLKNACNLDSNNYLRRNYQAQNFDFKNFDKKWSRVKETNEQNPSQEEEELEKDLENFFSLTYVSPCYMNFTGRILLNVWRLMRKEIALTSYTFENTYFHVCHRRVPLYSYRQLNAWFFSSNHGLRWRVFEYFLVRVNGCLQILNKLDIIGRNSELARVFGIQFSDVISKGTQFRVESLLYRSAIKHTKKVSFRRRSSEQAQRFQDYMLLSCDFLKRAKQHDPEMIPFVMNPFSGFYTDPVAVLDFQSLYPSVMIAYNYCYSTCLGRLDSLIEGNAANFGCSTLKLDEKFLKKHLNHITISPNGLVFLKKDVRKGTLCGILEELLNTRVMVKNSIKLYNKCNQPNERLLRLLDARQLGLKLIANVTYGYTAAGFSGRMPCVELADAIISKGRETLMLAIQMVHNNKHRFGGEVIYGDTDSMFIRFTGISPAEAFQRSQKLCEMITLSNPKPIKIKLEKIYTRCVLLTKKRYAGFALECPQDTEAKLDCKGIETVRRDSIPLVKRVMNKALYLLFTCNNEPVCSSPLEIPNSRLNFSLLVQLEKELRAYLEHEFKQLLKHHRRNLHEFVFAREYRGLHGYRKNVQLPSMVIAQQLVQRYGMNCLPFSKQRVPYVVICGEKSNDPLVKLVRMPLDVLRSEKMRLNCGYYIEKVLLPPLQRVFGLLGWHLIDWYRELPRKSRYLSIGYENCQAGSVAQYFRHTNCVVCEQQVHQSHGDVMRASSSMCNQCANAHTETALELIFRLKDEEKNFLKTARACFHCTGSNDFPAPCSSLDCPNFYKVDSVRVQMDKRDQIKEQLNELAVRFYTAVGV